MILCQQQQQKPHKLFISKLCMGWHFHWQCHHMREYSWLHMGLVSIHIQSPATLTLLPLFTCLEVLPFEVVKTEMMESCRIEDRRPNEILLCSSWQPKNLKLWLAQKALQAVWLPWSVVVSRIAPSDSIADIGLTSPRHGVFPHL